MTDTPPSPRHPLVGRVQELANRAHALAVASDRPDLADRLEQEATRYRVPQTTVIVVGEVKRGKSALINAMVDAPELLPVDVDVASNVHVAVSFGSPGATVIRDGAESVAVSLSDLGDWASERGNPGNERRVRAVDVRAQHALLADGVVLVDTPGIGGLDAAHSAVTFAALVSADALLFTIDASSPISTSELRFLERATDRIETVIFAVTKIDAFRGWREITDANRMLIAQHAPRFAGAPMVPVSARMAEFAGTARSQGNEAMAERARNDSGLDTLEQTLRETVVARAATVRLANMTYVVATTVDRLREVYEARRQAATGDDSARIRLGEEQERLRSVLDTAARWRVELDNEIRQVALDFDDELEWAIAEIDRQLEQRIGRGGAKELETLDGDLTSTLEAVWLNVNSFLGDRVVKIVDALAESLRIDGVTVDLGEFEMPERVASLIRARRTGVSDGSEGIDSKFLNYYPVVYAGSGAAMVANWMTAIVPGAGALAGGPLAALGAGAIGGMFMLRRGVSRRNRDVRDATRFVKGTLPQARSMMSKQFSRTMLEIRRRIEAEVTDRLDRRRRALEALVGEQQALLQKNTADRQRAATDAQRQLAALEGLSSRASELRRQLHDGNESVPRGIEGC